ncbi:hypothetical protein M3Y99_01460100 [Aphelenchoides fujianensis]|nr:hypothetical protein M3Y99_01460100 [Aphelenchoides fujianensis]
MRISDRTCGMPIQDFVVCLGIFNVFMCTVCILFSNPEETPDGLVEYLPGLTMREELHRWLRIWTPQILSIGAICVSILCALLLVVGNRTKNPVFYWSFLILQWLWIFAYTFIAFFLSLLAFSLSSMKNVHIGLHGRDHHELSLRILLSDVFMAVYILLHYYMTSSLFQRARKVLQQETSVQPADDPAFIFKHAPAPPPYSANPA